MTKITRKTQIANEAGRGCIIGNPATLMRRSQAFLSEEPVPRARAPWHICCASSSISQLEVAMTFSSTNVPPIRCPVRRKVVSSLLCHSCENHVKVQFRSEGGPELQCTRWDWGFKSSPGPD